MAPRTMWKGAVSFGLVNIPVRMYPATEERTVKFNQLHGADGGRIHYDRVCNECGETVPYEDIMKGYEFEKGAYVVLTQADFDAVTLPSVKAIEIMQFVSIGEIDPTYFQKTYYVMPEEVGTRGYALMREAMNALGKAGIAKVTFREKEHLAVLRFQGDTMVLETMYWPDEIRQPEPDSAKAMFRAAEVQMAKSLVDSMTEPWDPAQYRDEYREALLEVVEQRAAGRQAVVAAETVEPRPTKDDMMAALEASVQAANKKRGTAKKATRKPRARKTA